MSATNRFVAYVVPAVGAAPVKRGDLGAVIAAVDRLLTSHPGYTVTVRRAERHQASVHVHRHPDGYQLTLVPNAGYGPRLTKDDALLADVRLVFTNLGAPIHNPQEQTT